MMAANIGFVTQQGVSISDNIQTASDAGFDYVEILMDGETHRTKLAADSERIRDLLTSANIDVMVHLPFPINLGGPHESLRTGGIDTLKANIETAQSLGADKGVFHPNTTAWGAAWSSDELRETIIDAVRKLEAFATDRGFELCAENIPGTVYPIKHMSTLLNAVNVSMTLDTGHAHLSGYDSTDIASFVDTHHDVISHLHLNDNRGQSDTHLPLGAGSLDFETILTALPADWDGTLSIEVATTDLDYIVESYTRIAPFVSST